MPDPAAQLRSRRIERIAAGEQPASQGIADNIEIPRENVRTLRTIKPKGCKGGRVSAGSDPEFKTAVRQQVENRRILRHYLTRAGLQVEFVENGRAGTDGHYGIVSMRERADGIKASFALDSAIGRGTRIAVVLPAANESKSAR